MAPEPISYSVTPAHDGGWSQWSANLQELLRSFGDLATKVVVIEQPQRTGRYVQVLVGHGIAYAEASSNVYLTGASRLSGVEERLLDLVGWQPPVSTDPTGTKSCNWHLPLVYGDWTELGEVLTATLAGVFGLSEQLPVDVHTFGAAHPCRSCSWPDEDTGEIDETYGTLGF